jgi:hypothetical protein
MATSAVRYLVFDVESVADGALVSRIQYPGQGLAPDEAIARYREELREKHDSDFVPYTFQIPISIAVAKVAADYRIPTRCGIVMPRTCWKKASTSGYCNSTWAIRTCRPRRSICI